MAGMAQVVEDMPLWDMLGLRVAELYIAAL